MISLHKIERRGGYERGGRYWPIEEKEVVAKSLEGVIENCTLSTRMSHTTIYSEVETKTIEIPVTDTLFRLNTSQKKFRVIGASLRLDKDERVIIYSFGGFEEQKEEICVDGLLILDDEQHPKLEYIANPDYYFVELEKKD